MADRVIYLLAQGDSPDSYRTNPGTDSAPKRWGIKRVLAGLSAAHGAKVAGYWTRADGSLWVSFECLKGCDCRVCREEQDARECAYYA